MSRKFYALIISILIIASLVVQATSNKATNVNSQTTESKKTENLKWEYCEISGINNDYDNFSQTWKGGVASISYFTSSGIKEERIVGRNLPEAKAKALAKLGEEGWEMVQQGEFNGSDRVSGVTYFKRPKQ